MKIRNTDTPISEDSKLTLNVELDIVPTTLPNLQENIVEDVISVSNNDPSSSRKTELWKQEDYDAPKSEFSVHSRSFIFFYAFNT